MGAMRLVIATPLYPPEIGGPATYARLLEEGLPGKGIEVEVVKFGEVRHLPKLLRHIAYYGRIRRALRQADLVLALDPVSVGLPASLAARRAGKPFVVKVVGDYAWEQGRQRFSVTAELDEFVKTRQRSPRVRVLQRIQTAVADYAQTVIVPSEYLKHIIAQWGIRGEKLSVIYNAVALGEIGSVPQPVADVPKPLIVSVGRLVPWKRLDGLIDAVASLRARGLAASLVIVGDGPERKRIETYAAKELGSAYVFTGPLPHADTLAVVKAADVFVLNSTYEGLSHTLIEASLLGTAIVATDAGGNLEVIHDGESGVLVPPLAPEALLEALTSLLGNAPLRTRLGVNAKLAAARFSTKTMLDATADLISKLVTSGMISS